MGTHEIRWMYHATAMVDDYDAAVEVLARLIGLRVLEFGESEMVGRRGGMTWFGDGSLELGQPNPTGPVRRFVDRFGPGMHSVAAQVTDLDATIANFEAHDVRLAVRPAPFFCFSDPRDTAGVLIEWNQDHPGIEVYDPRFGAEVPPLTVEPVLDVTQIAWVGALVDEPDAVLDLLAGLFGPTTFRDPAAGPGQPVGGVSVGDCTLAVFDRSAVDDGAPLWAKAYDRNQVHVLALRVPDLRAAATTLAGAGVGVVRDDERGIVLDPADTGQVPLLLTDSLLPGDPRGT